MPSPCLIALEIGGTKLQAAWGDDAGRILALQRARVPGGADAGWIRDWVRTALLQLLESPPPGVDPASAAIGVGFGGPVCAEEGRVLASHQVPGWAGYPLRAWLASIAGDRRIVVANDANAAGWAEYLIGAGQGRDPFVYMNIGSGIGGALVIGGRLHDGQGLGAAEIGHTYVPDWSHAEPGQCIKLENLCSGWAIEARLRNQLPTPEESLLSRWSTERGVPPSCALLGEAARAGDAFAEAELDRVAGSLGIALANVIAITAPRRIALGGGVSLLGSVLLDRIRLKVEERIFGPYRGTCDIVPCALGEDVVLAGALLLAGESRGA